MANWLFKTEPSSYSYDDLEKDKKATWDGVSNALALKYLRQIKKGDQALIYHTGDVKAIIGVAEITASAYVDPKQNDPKLVVVDLKPKHRLSKEVSLSEIKAKKEFQDFLSRENEPLERDAGDRRSVETSGRLTSYMQMYPLMLKP